MPSGTLHTLLPRAIALGVTDAWLSRFSGRAVPPSEWYTTPAPVGVGELGGEIKHLHDLLRPHVASATETAATRR
jgi:hypothetical protein